MVRFCDEWYRYYFITEKKYETFSRLCFKADIIEPLNDNDEFAVHTPFGVFQMTKAEFYETFPNIVKTESYQKNRIYSMKNPTKKALRFLTNAKPNMNLQVNGIKPIKDLIGNEIREKIREIGELWRNSKYNPQIDNELLQRYDLFFRLSTISRKICEIPFDNISF